VHLRMHLISHAVLILNVFLVCAQTKDLRKRLEGLRAYVSLNVPAAKQAQELQLLCTFDVSMDELVWNRWWRDKGFAALEKFNAGGTEAATFHAEYVAYVNRRAKFVWQSWQAALHRLRIKGKLFSELNQLGQRIARAFPPLAALATMPMQSPQGKKRKSDRMVTSPGVKYRESKRAQAAEIMPQPSTNGRFVAVADQELAAARSVAE